MKNPSLDESVLLNPVPCLDQHSDTPYQFLAYKETLQRLYGGWVQNVSIITSIAAGAGSGKTRLMTAILNGLINLDVEPNLLEAVSFTNASSDDFRRKHVEAQIQNASSADQASLVNICFSTIHQNAANMLRKLQPHMGGVGYYFEDSQSGSLEEDGDEERKRAVRLALYSSVVYGKGDDDLLSKLSRYIEGNEKTFILEDLGNNHHYEHAKKFIREEMVSDAGLGAFTNMGEGGPDFCIAVATDALMRLYAADISINQKRRVYRMPAFLLLDEAQDLDFLQLLYLRAMALNGTSVIMVGDSRQTLYEFRQSISDLPFNEGFLKDLVAGTHIEASVSQHTLNTNYRSRKEIVDGAEEISTFIVEYAKKRNKGPKPSKYIELIEDHKTANGEAYITNENCEEKKKAAISVIIGSPVRSNVITEKPVKDGLEVHGAMKLLNKALSKDKSLSLQKSDKSKKKRITQLLALSGGENEANINLHICNLFERAKLGETSAILARQGLRDADIELIKHIIKNKYPNESPRLNLISPPKHTALSEYWLLDEHYEAKKELPFSSIMVTGALAFYIASDKETRERLQIAGLREVKTIFSGPANAMQDRNDRQSLQSSIEEELIFYFDALRSRIRDVFTTLSDSDEAVLFSEWDNLRAIVARYTCDILFRYGRLEWEETKVARPIPCRFHYIATQYIEKRYSGMAVRPLKDTKRYLKRFWRALATTPFAMTEKELVVMRRSKICIEYMDANTTLLNFPESLITFFEIHGHKHASLDSYKRPLLEDRETVYEELSRLFHLKTRTYMREIARGIGRVIRNNPHATEEGIYQAVYDENYLAARYNARLSITKKPNKDQYGGLFSDLVDGMKREASLQRRNNRSVRSNDQPTIDLTTIHSSKGLEWDHVILYFPQPSPNDQKSTFKSFRDLIYVAMTRAARTLTIVIQKPKQLTESPSDTGIKVINKLIHDWADENGYYNRYIDYGEITPHRDRDEGVEVFEETSHSELERAQTCRIDHYNENIRSLSTMVPLTAPSYAFFFHSSMSTICAAYIDQRIPSSQDPSKEISNAVRQITRKRMGEEKAFQYLQQYTSDSLYALMESMIPMYFISDRQNHTRLMTYYVDSFTRHLASVSANAKLFHMLEKYKENNDYQILIEKSIRSVIRSGNDFLPTQGIPDIKIQGPNFTYVCDYKTVPIEDEQHNEQDYIRKVSEKTERQINFYQGMVPRNLNQEYLAELLYVADITVLDGEEIPEFCKRLPYIDNGTSFNVVANADHARIFWTDSLDTDKFNSIIQDISQLRNYYAAAGALPTDDIFQPCPLVGNEYLEVSSEQCRLCPSKVHCQQNKSDLIDRGL